MNTIEKNKAARLKIIKSAADEKKPALYSAGDDRTSYQGNQMSRVISFFQRDEAREPL